MTNSAHKRPYELRRAAESTLRRARFLELLADDDAAMNAQLAAYELNRLAELRDHAGRVIFDDRLA